MKMQSKWLYATLLAPVVVGVVSCGGTVSSSSSSLSSTSVSSNTSVSSSVYVESPLIVPMDEFRAIESIDVTFWHAMGAANQLIIEEFIDGFETLYPNVHVTQASQGNYVDLERNVGNALGLGTTPTIVQGYPDHYAGYLQVEGLIPLNGYINSQIEEIGVDLTDYVDSYVGENMQFGGDFLFGLPFNKSTEVFTYNKTKFDELNLVVPDDRPLTWDEVADFAEVIKEDTGKIPFAYDSSANLFITLVRQWGGSYTKSTGTSTKDHVLFGNSSETLTALQYYKDMHAAGLFTLPAEWELNYASDAFKIQETFMAVGSNAGVKYNIPASGEFELGVAPVPQFSSSTKAVIQQGTNLAIMANHSKAEMQAAWLFIKYATSVANTLRWATGTGYLPVRKSAFADESFQKYLGITNPESSYFVTPESYLTLSPADQVYYDLNKVGSMTTNAAYKQLGYMFYDPAFVGSSYVRTLVGSAAEDTILGEYTPAEAVAKAMDQIPG